MTTCQCLFNFNNGSVHDCIIVNIRKNIKVETDGLRVIQQKLGVMHRQTI